MTLQPYGIDFYMGVALLAAICARLALKKVCQAYACSSWHFAPLRDEALLHQRILLGPVIVFVLDKSTKV